MKQKIITWAVTIVIAAIGFPFYWVHTHGPDSTVDSMFTGLAFTGEVGNYCTSDAVKEQVKMGLGLIIMQNGMKEGVEHEVAKTDKRDDGTATVAVKLTSGSKTAAVDFTLEKEEGFFGSWKISGIAKGK